MGMSYFPLVSCRCLLRSLTAAWSAIPRAFAPETSSGLSELRERKLKRSAFSAGCAGRERKREREKERKREREKERKPKQSKERERERERERDREAFTPAFSFAGYGCHPIAGGGDRLFASWQR